MQKLINWLATLSFKKLFTWLDKHILKILVVVLLIWIPLYPKFPLVDVVQTWVYIRLEDFLVAFTALVFIFLLLRKKTRIKSPLTKPIILYWFAGAISVIWAFLFFTTSSPQVFPHLVVLHFLRRIEYMILFFVVVASIKKVEDIYVYLAAIFASLTGVLFYGLGQRFLRFPAFLTMNEEFAKGLPLFLPPTARITSTFGGHYDLAAYLVLLIALSVSLIFVSKRWWMKILLIIITALSFLSLLLTASRISFFAYLLAISLVLFFQKKKILIIPVIVLSVFLMQKLTGGTSIRFGKTFRVEPVVFETKTGKPIATLEQFIAEPTPTPKGPLQPTKPPSPSTGGEDLPTGTGFLALPWIYQEPEKKVIKIKDQEVFLESLETATVSSEIATASGEFLLASGNYFIKKAIVYDISFTTRLQGEWPRAWQAFKRHPLLGSGYSSVSLATDNDYLRSLGETGIVGFLTFWGIFFILILLSKQILKWSTHALLKTLVIGLLGGLFGLLFNAILIDVFEASKVSFVFWMLVGIVFGLAKLYPSFGRSLRYEALEVISSHFFILLVFGFLTFFCFNLSFKNYFVADDFIWLKWAHGATLFDIRGYFFNSEGFFYRPLVKVVFLFLQPIFGLEPDGFHFLSQFFHFFGVAAVYLIAFKLLGKKFPAILVGFFFLLHPIHEESVFWISSFSGLMAAVFYFSSFLFYLLWREKKKVIRYGFWLFSLLFFVFSLLSHELALTLPLALVFYNFLWKKYQNKFWQEGLYFLPYAVIVIIYLLMRDYSGAHNLSGDYSYRLSNLPFNFLGNFMGYLGELLFSFRAVPLYQQFRFFFKTRKVICLVLSLIGLGVFSYLVVYFRRREIGLPRIVIFSLGWMFITLLPFLGLGNMAERYSYLASFGFLLILVYSLDWLLSKFRAKTSPKLSFIIFLIIILMISSFYYSELLKANRDWQEAGEVSKKTLLALSSNYKQFPQDANLIFVDLPVKKGLAWVFPVGLKEAVWFIYRDETLQIYRSANLEEALDLKERLEGPCQIFFLDDGELKRVAG